MADGRDDPGGTPVPPPLIYAGGLLLGLALDRTFPLPFLSKEASRAVGLPLLTGGALLAGWFGRTMRRAGTPFRLDEPATTLATGGPFRYSRNPGYLSFAMVQAGTSLLLNGTWGVLAVPATTAVIGRPVVEHEERYLERLRRTVPALQGERAALGLGSGREPAQRLE